MNRLLRKTIPRVMLLIAVVVWIPCGPKAEENVSAINFEKDVSYFCCNSGSPPLPDINLLQDPQNNRILNESIRGATQADLVNAGIPDTAMHVDSLVKGRWIGFEDDGYRITIPILVGDRREAIQKVVNDAVQPAVGKVAVSIERLSPAINGRRDILFHLVWSRSMDKIWGPAWSVAFPKIKGMPNVAWVLKPDHPYQVGTNYHTLPGNGEIAITWDFRSLSHIKPTMAAREDLARIAWGLPPSASSNIDALRSAGCLDIEGRVKPFVIHSGDKVDKLTKSIAKEYAGIVARLYDYNALSSRFHIPSGQLFIILQHETAYSIFQALVAEGVLEFPPALDREGHREACSQLVSLLLRKKPK